MKRIFVTTDTHGCYDELKYCLDQANFNYEIDQLIHCGDVVDRGPKVRELVDFLLSIKNLVPIRGNHDEYWLDAITTGVFYANIEGGADKTRDSYISGEQNPHSLGVTLNVPQSHREFFKNQVMYHIDEQNRFFCHAGYNRSFEVQIQTSNIFYFDRNLMTEIMMYPEGHSDKIYDFNNFKRVFIGHTPTISWYDTEENRINKPIYRGQFVQIDTGGVFKAKNGKISLLDITDDDNHILYQN